MAEPRSTYEYDDFRLTFESTGMPGSYRVLAIDMATGAHAKDSFALNASDRHRVDTFAHAMRGARREVGVSHEAATDAEEIGGHLATMLLGGPVRSLYDDAYERVRPTFGRGLRLSLALSDAPDLVDVPWEFLFVRPRFLASQERTPVVRLLGTAPPMPAAPVDGALRVLAVVASPRDLPALDVKAERARIEQATRPISDQGLVMLDWLEAASPRRLRERLQDGSFHVLHFIGHSDFTADGIGVILLEQDDGSAVEVDQTLLANLVDGQSASLRLVVLNSCKGARSTPHDPRAGVAATLMSLGLPAVVAMQFPISDAAAIVFAEALYASLIVRRQPVDAAVSAGRLAIWTDVSDVEWATPVLFMRDPNASAFTFPRPFLSPAPAAVANPIAPTPMPPSTAPPPSTTVTNSGPVSIGGNVIMSGENVIGRDQVTSAPRGKRRRRR